MINTPHPHLPHSHTEGKDKQKTFSKRNGNHPDHRLFLNYSIRIIDKVKKRTPDLIIFIFRSSEAIPYFLQWQDITSLSNWECVGGCSPFHFNKMERRAKGEAKARTLPFATGSWNSSGVTPNSATRGSGSTLCFTIPERVSKTELSGAGTVHMD